jgi:hypothetical protein
MDPATLAARVLDAIRAGHYWIFPHGHMLPAITENAAAIVAQETPVFDFARAWKTGGEQS